MAPFGKAELQRPAASSVAEDEQTGEGVKDPLKRHLWMDVQHIQVTFRSHSPSKPATAKRLDEGSRRLSCETVEFRCILDYFSMNFVPLYFYFLTSL